MPISTKRRSENVPAPSSPNKGSLPKGEAAGACTPGPEARGAEPIKGGASAAKLATSAPAVVKPKAGRKAKAGSAASAPKDLPIASGADMGVVSDPSATGAEIISEIVKEPSLDVFLDRHPDDMKPQDFKLLVDMLRGARTRFIAKAEKKKEAADGSMF